MDEGLFIGNYDDYFGDEQAIEAEADFVKRETFWSDPAFPPDGRSLYFDPVSPPTGSISADFVKWNRISKNEINNCVKPTYFVGDHNSTLIDQGFIGNSYFVNGLRLFSCRSSYVNRLLVSDKHAHKGIYTFKIFKCGRWRYVHIDDRIPCRMSGKVQYCRNDNPNETFAMLLEKAYAKLHGCYEALACGSISKCMMDMLPGGIVRVLRSEKISHQSLSRLTYEGLFAGKTNGQLMGCGRYIPDPYCEGSVARRGITLGCMYQIMDVCTVTAGATEDLDALTVIMVCIRNLQKKPLGKFNGRWSAGDSLWVEYPEIGEQLRHRTRQIQFERGIGKQPVEGTTDEDFMSYEMPNRRIKVAADTGIKLKPGAAKKKPIVEDFFNDDDEEEPAVEIIQPRTADLFWIQMEDYCSIFNRTFIVTDYSSSRGYSNIRINSRWVAGDGVVGSGGPPFLFQPISDEVVFQQEQFKEKELEVDRDSLAGSGVQVVEDDEEEEWDEEDEEEEDAESKEHQEVPLEEDVPYDPFQLPNDEATIQNNGNPADLNGNMIGFQSSYLTAESMATNSMARSSWNNDANMLLLQSNDKSFLDNPMYPISVTAEETTIIITLYQNDRRWSVARTGVPSVSEAVEASTVPQVQPSPFSTRGDILGSSMKYGVGIGFVVMRLTDDKKRVGCYRNRKVAGACEVVEYASCVTEEITLPCGRYAIIPYTHAALPTTTPYTLHVQLKEREITFETENVIDDRLEDDEYSEDEPDTDDELMPNQNSQGTQSFHRFNPEELAELSFSRSTVSIQDGKRKPISKVMSSNNNISHLTMGTVGLTNKDPSHNRSGIDEDAEEVKDFRVKAPVLRADEEWEWREAGDGADCDSLVVLYEEVGEMCSSLKALRTQVGAVRSTAAIMADRRKKLAARIAAMS